MVEMTVILHTITAILIVAFYMGPKWNIYFSYTFQKEQHNSRAKNTYSREIPPFGLGKASIKKCF